MTTKAEKILSGDAGLAVKALTLSSLNWKACASLTKHPQLKQPVNRGFVEDVRDEVRLPELESVIEPEGLDILVSRVIASYLLTEGMRRATDINERGQTIRPYEYLKPKTPSEAIRDSYSWRSDMAGKELAAKAILMGIKDPHLVAAKAKAAADGRNIEALAYALAECTSNTNKSLMTWDDAALVDLLLDMQVVETAKAAAENAISRARARIEAGLWADIDPEILLFVKA